MIAPGQAWFPVEAVLSPSICARDTGGYRRSEAVETPTQGHREFSGAQRLLLSRLKLFKLLFDVKQDKAVVQGHRFL